MATYKILQTLCFIALLSTTLSLPLAVEETAQVEAKPVVKEEVVVKDEKLPEVVHDPVPKPVVVEHQVEHHEQPAGREEPAAEVQPQVVVHEPAVVQRAEDEVVQPVVVPSGPVGVEVSAGNVPDDLAASVEANPGGPESDGASDLETANTFGFGWGYRPYWGGGYRRGWYGRGYGGGWGGGWGGYYGGYPRWGGYGWRHGGYWG